jgi:hypothetical protein
VAFSEQFFGDQAGRVSAICIATMQLGGAALAALIATGLRFLDWHTVLIIYGIVCGGGGALLEIICIHKPSEEVQARVAELRATKSQEGKTSQSAGITLKEGLKTVPFWLFVAAMMLGAISLAALGTYGTVFFTSFGLSVSEATYLTSFSLLFCGINVLWTGAMLERKIGARNYILFFNIAIIIGFAIMFVWTAMPAYIWLVLLSSFFVSFNQCATNVPAILVPKTFGFKDFNGFQSAFTGFYYLGVFTSQAFSALIFDALGPAAMIAFIGCTTAASMICFLITLVLSKKLTTGKMVEQL